MMPLKRQIFHHLGVRAVEPEWDLAAEVRETVCLSWVGGMLELWPVWPGSVTAPAPAPDRDPEGDLSWAAEALL